MTSNAAPTGVSFNVRVPIHAHAKATPKTAKGFADVPELWLHTKEWCARIIRKVGNPDLRQNPHEQYQAQRPPSPKTIESFSPQMNTTLIQLRNQCKDQNSQLEEFFLFFSFR